MQINRTYNLVTTALTTTIIILCSWITVPIGAVPITLQTFAIFMCAILLGEKKGTLSFIVYILLGIVGLPVFSSFQSGFGVLLGATGGYLFGFIFITLIGGFFCRKFPDNMILTYIGLVTGLFFCYTSGTLWYVYMYLKDFSWSNISSVLLTCVLPYIIPDLIKMQLAIILSKKIKTVLKGKLK